MKDKTQGEFAYVELLSEAMKRTGWKAADLSRASGVSEGVISRTLKGGRNLTGLNLFKMLSALGVISTTNYLDKDVNACILPELYEEDFLYCCDGCDGNSNCIGNCYYVKTRCLSRCR